MHGTDKRRDIKKLTITTVTIRQYRFNNKNKATHTEIIPGSLSGREPPKNGKIALLLATNLGCVEKYDSRKQK